MTSGKAKTRRQVDPSILDRLTDGFLDLIDTSVQLVENPEDWGAESITIRYFENPDRTTDLWFIDDGVGMDEDGRNAFTCACGSQARNDEGKKGRNGTGRLGFIHHSARSITYTKAASGRPHTIELSRANMWEAWFGNGTPLAWTEIPRLPADIPIRTTGVVTILKALGTGEGVVARRDRRAKRLIEQLATKLSPHVARKVTVEIWRDGQRVESHKLQERKIEGKPIEGDFHKLPEIGDVSYSLFVVANPDKSNDQLMVGAKGPVCTWGEFTANMRRDERYAEFMRGIEPVLGHPKVVGLLNIPVLNKFAVNNRKAFSTDLLEDEELVHALLTWLRRHLVPLVEKELGMRAEQIFTTDDRVLVADLCRTFQQATGMVPPARRVAVLELNRHRVELEPGERFLFEIKSPRPGASYAWSLEGDGRLGTKTGIRVEFTAGGIGTSTIAVREVGVLDETPVTTVTVKVVARLPLRFTRPTVSMSTNDRCTLQLTNVHNTSGNLVWEFEGGWGCVPTVSEDLTEANIVSGTMEGRWDVRVYDRDNPDETWAICGIVVREGSHEEAETRRSSENTFVYGGHTFELRGTNLRSDRPEVARQMSYLETHGDLTVITCNFGHPACQYRTDEGRRAFASHLVFARVAQRLNPNASPGQLNQHMAVIGAELLSGAMR